MTVTTETLATTDLEFARQLGQQLRVDSIRCSTAAGSGHPTSSMSSADIDTNGAEVDRAGNHPDALKQALEILEECAN